MSGGLEEVVTQFVRGHAADRACDEAVQKITRESCHRPAERLGAHHSLRDRGQRDKEQRGRSSVLDRGHPGEDSLRSIPAGQIIGVQ